MNSINLFSFDDLFLTTRDRQLRALNRLIFFENLKKCVPKVSRLYLKFVKEIDPTAASDFVQVKRHIDRDGLPTVKKRLKYRINPYEDHEVHLCSKPSLSLY